MSTRRRPLQLPATQRGEPPVSVEVWGPGALFTRPEFKAERVSYPVMTPSAAKGILESIFWKPEMTYRIVAIEVLRLGREFTVMRNETSDVAPLADAVNKERRIDTAATRDQRSAHCLKDVRYRIHAHIDLKDHATKPVPAYRDQMRRRVNKGTCFNQPYLGTREFTAAFGPATDIERISLTRDLGIMLHSVDHSTKDSAWFTARLDDGVLYVPEHGIARPTPKGDALC
jgi:CRISPR-associated protein Cas5d